MTLAQTSGAVLLFFEPMVAAGREAPRPVGPGFFIFLDCLRDKAGPFSSCAVGGARHPGGWLLQDTQTRGPEQPAADEIFTASSPFGAESVHGIGRSEHSQEEKSGWMKSAGRAVSSREQAPVKPWFQGVAGRRAASFGHEAE